MNWDEYILLSATQPVDHNHLRFLKCKEAAAAAGAARVNGRDRKLGDAFTPTSIVGRILA
jgi:hypothetical protein